jgi:uncharacterized lipoprotein NlpE involved in copper resistance
MKIILLYCIFLATAILNCSCGGNAKKEITVVEKALADSSPVVSSQQHNSASSLDWQGTYKGTLPCADCEGIATEITLNKDNSYLIKTTYLGKENKTTVEKGNFIWNDLGSIVTLTGIKNKPNKYIVGENKLIQLDIDGNKITGSLADKYILKK